MDIKSFRDLYTQIPTDEVERDTSNDLAPVDQDLMDKTINHLNDEPQFTPRVK